MTDAPSAPSPRPASLTRFAWLSISAALVTIGLKTAAYLITGSVGLLSDAVESLVNLVGGLMALWMLKVAEQPADEDHPYGHSKAEFFSSGVEGSLILVAAVSIAVAAILRLVHPKPIEGVGLGLAVAVAASVVNLVVALVILKAGRKAHSITLEANGHHLMTDVWTSAGVVVAVAAVAATGWQRLDPIVALLVAANIIWTGVRIVRCSVAGLMDEALPLAERDALQAILQRHQEGGVEFHAIRTRQAGAWRFVDFHVLLPGDWTVHRGHEFVERVEAEIRQVIPNVTLSTHMESLADPASWEDQELRRNSSRADRQ